MFDFNFQPGDPEVEAGEHKSEGRNKDRVQGERDLEQEPNFSDQGDSGEGEHVRGADRAGDAEECIIKKGSWI